MAWYDPRTWAARSQRYLFSFRDVQQRSVQRLQARGREWRERQGLPPRPTLTIQEQEVRRVGVEAKRKPLTIKKGQVRTPTTFAAFGGVPSFTLPSFTRVKEFVGISASQQRKIMQKELEDVKRIEKQYIKSGELRPTHEAIRPSDIGRIAGVYKEVGPVRPTPRADYTYVGKPEYQRQISKVESLERQLKPHIVGGVYTSPAITAFERKWSGKIKGGQFVGTDVEYRKYQKELTTAQRAQERELAGYTTATTKLTGMEPAYESRYQALTKEYGEYERARAKQEELHGASIFGKYERAEERGGKAIAARVPSVSAMLAPARTPEMEAESRRVYAQYRQMFGLPPEPFKWERYVGRAEAEYKRHIIEGMRREPIKTAVTGAVFTALPPVLKGAKYAFKPVAKVGVKALPRAAPWIGKWVPPAVGYGITGVYGYTVGKRVYEAPPGMRAAVAGQITGTELLPMGMGTAIGLKALKFKKPSFDISKIKRPTIQRPKTKPSKRIEAEFVEEIAIPYIERPPIDYEWKPSVFKKPTAVRKVKKIRGVKKEYRAPEIFYRRPKGLEEIFRGKKPYIPKEVRIAQPPRAVDYRVRKPMDIPASRYARIKEISMTTDIARKRALEATLKSTRTAKKEIKGYQEIWRKREIETARKIRAGELQVQEMAGGELGLLQITKVVKVKAPKVKAAKVKTIETAKMKQAQYQELIQKQIREQRVFAVPAYVQKQVQIQKEMVKQAQSYKQYYELKSVQVAEQKSVAAMKEEAAQRIRYVGIQEYKVYGVQIPKMVEIMEYAPMIKYKVPVVPAVIMPQPPIVPLLLYKPPKEKKVKKRKYKREPYAWIVKNPIPTMRQMMTTDMNKIMADMKKAQTAGPKQKKRRKKR